jgi:hypothetical protein
MTTTPRDDASCPTPTVVEADALAEFQSALLRLLAEARSPEDTLAQLRARPEFRPFADYVATFDARAVATAIELVQRWGRRLDGG